MFQGPKYIAPYGDKLFKMFQGPRGFLAPYGHNLF